MERRIQVAILPLLHGSLVSAEDSIRFFILLFILQTSKKWRSNWKSTGSFSSPSLYGLPTRNRLVWSQGACNAGLCVCQTVNCPHKTLKTFSTTPKTVKKKSLQAQTRRTSDFRHPKLKPSIRNYINMSWIICNGLANIGQWFMSVYLRQTYKTTADYKVAQSASKGSVVRTCWPWSSPFAKATCGSRSSWSCSSRRRSGLRGVAPGKQRAVRWPSPADLQRQSVSVLRVFTGVSTGLGAAQMLAGAGSGTFIRGNQVRVPGESDRDSDRHIKRMRQCLTQGKKGGEDSFVLLLLSPKMWNKQTKQKNTGRQERKKSVIHPTEPFFEIPHWFFKCQQCIRKTFPAKNHNGRHAYAYGSRSGDWRQLNATATSLWRENDVTHSWACLHEFGSQTAEELSDCWF